MNQKIALDRDTQTQGAVLAIHTHLALGRAFCGFSQSPGASLMSQPV